MMVSMMLNSELRHLGSDLLDINMTLDRSHLFFFLPLFTMMQSKALLC